VLPDPFEPPEVLAGGEQAVMPMRVAAASAAAPVRRRDGPFTQASSGHVDPGVVFGGRVCPAAAGWGGDEHHGYA
jgi:hypothetical protein